MLFMQLPVHHKPGTKNNSDIPICRIYLHYCKLFRSFYLTFDCAQFWNLTYAITEKNKENLAQSYCLSNRICFYAYIQAFFILRRQAMPNVICLLFHLILKFIKPCFNMKQVNLLTSAFSYSMQNHALLILLLYSTFLNSLLLIDKLKVPHIMCFCQATFTVIKKLAVIWRNTKTTLLIGFKLCRNVIFNILH